MEPTQDPDVKDIAGQWTKHVAATMDKYLDTCMATRQAILAGQYNMKSLTADVGTFSDQVAKDSGKTIKLALTSVEQLMPFFKNTMGAMADLGKSWSSDSGSVPADSSAYTASPSPAAEASSSSDRPTTG